ncbi:MAG TPA: GTP 3',8-cyclase MoaA [Sphaerochaeta sp.]|nr:GTP 3',8-cyclase MoaA [Sphaerochaeta sp.]HCS37482.1 GTP 3',8-cyclase MoaA [Sphaerochaeta sp.]
MVDACGRTLDYLRISITDQCNLRCRYCMPEQGIRTVSHDELLSYEEIERFVEIAARLGLKKIKITGGEPLLRPDVHVLIGKLKRIEGIQQITLTTNGTHLGGMLDTLLSAGLDAVNINLSATTAGLFEATTRRQGFESVMDSLYSAISSGLKTKINCVPLQGFHEPHILDIASLARNLPVDVRFIELMPIGCGSNYTYIDRQSIESMLVGVFGSPIRVRKTLGNGPASYISFQGFMGNIGFISALSDCFCPRCNRLRLTSTGFLKSCLNFDIGADMRMLLRNESDDRRISRAILDVVRQKPLHHEFHNESIAHKELHLMTQIGG